MIIVRYLDFETAQTVLYEDTFVRTADLPGAPALTPRPLVVPRMGEHVRIRPKDTAVVNTYVVVGVLHDLGHELIEVYLKGPV